MKLKENAFIVTSDHAHRAILYDMYTAQKYEIPYDIGKRQMKTHLMTKI